MSEILHVVQLYMTYAKLTLCVVSKINHKWYV